ncbi:hypothetical protein B0F90DRAFT_1777336 [Multifurca ochricompacta]|uniref:Uncharacterized protein n=1 Tax=Multifurca ochricompacta TaxID=376703 RepID=A0AAD4LXC0_9AGAM|nr:hypothetical protein B0F90DRAFT_1777336 [Multifurca ochricompacta]
MFRLPLPLPGPVTATATAAERSVSSPFYVHLSLPRRIRGFSLVLAVLATGAFLYTWSFLSSSSHRHQDDIPLYLQDLPKPEGGVDPPRFYEWHEREKRLPQHNPDLPFPQGREGRYIFFSNHVWGVGWGNAMQELLFNAHLAYLAKRTFVFDNYTWDKTSSDFSSFNDKRIPARVPLTALLSGPVAGDPFPPSTNGVPAVIPEFFNEVCPNRTIIDRIEVDGALPDASAATLLQAWLDKLEQTEDRCVEIKEHSGQIFNYLVFGDSTRLLDIWPSISKSPIITHFSWSPLILAALVANAQVIHPALSSISPSSFNPSASTAPLSGLLALHIRRGDYIDHCKNLANWYAHFMGFNEFPGLPDRFIPPPPLRVGDASEEDHAQYREHCFPEIEDIVRRVREVRASLSSTTQLRRVYVLTNGKPEWLEKLKEALQEDAKKGGMPVWEHIGTSRDLVLTGEQKHNSQAMDMAVAQRAEVFMGNGFSSMTSNVNMLRAAQGLEWNTMRFW